GAKYEGRVGGRREKGYKKRGVERDDDDVSGPQATTALTVPTPVSIPTPPPMPGPLDSVHTIFKKWLGDDYDTGVLDATLATGAAERLTGDPLWLMGISGPGN